MATACIESDKECTAGQMAVDAFVQTSPETAAEEYVVSTDRQRLDLGMIHDFLTNRSYWAQGISFERVQESIENSLCFGLYLGKKQVGFARVVTDYTAIAYLGDVFILEEFRDKGLGKMLIASILSHPDVQKVRLWFLATRDAQALYRKFGFRNLDAPERFMVRPNPFYRE